MNKKVLVVIGVIIVLIGVIVAVNLISSSTENETEGTTNSETQTSNSESDGVYSVMYNGVDVTPGNKFDELAIDEEYALSQISSCAFDGTDDVYTYSGVEITVANVDGVQTIYSVYFIDITVETAEGISIADSKDDMVEAYGAGTTNSTENQYVYDDGSVTLSFILNESDEIVSIEYTMDV